MLPFQIALMMGPSRAARIISILALGYKGFGYNQKSMERFVVVHYNELGLKKGNRDYFENRLCSNISSTLSDCDIGPVRRISGRLLVHLKETPDVIEIKKRMAGI